MSKEQFDEQMDELSREAANLQGLPFTEKAWQQMEQLLNKEEKRRRAIIWWWITPLALLLTGSSIYYAIHSKNTNLTIHTTQINVPTTIANNQIQKLDKSTTAQEEKAANNKTQNTTAIHTHDKHAAVKKTNTATTNFTKKNTSLLATNKDATNKQKRLQPTKKIVATPFADPSAINIATPATEKNIVQANKTVTENKEEKYNKTEVVQTELLQTEPNKLKKEEPRKTVDTSITATTKNEKSKIKKSILSRFEISAAAAADVTTVHFKNANKISTAYGIGITFFATKRLSIATGIGFAKKLYNADSADYESVPYFNRYTTVQKITADCRVIEIPINLQYLIRQNKNSSWLAAVGLSNYFMAKENYLYNYTESGVPKTTTYIFKNQNNHLLSVLNLAIAYRQKINQQLSWQINPFAKLPLTGIGQGKIQLSSIGLQGSLHFKLKK